MDTSLPSISRSELSSLLGRPDAPLVIDVRRAPRFAGSDTLVAAAIRCEPERVPALAAAGPPRKAVVYCVYGHEVSQAAVKHLRDAGWDARYLKGGIEGGEEGVDAPDDVARWRAEPLAVIRKRPELGVTGEGPSRWITRARPKIDRVACPWLIRRFIDPRAEFFYTDSARVFEEADRLGAVPFDIEGAKLSHAWERCSFDAILREFGLHSPVLDRMATIVRGADTSRTGIAPEAGGLLALSLGMSRLYEDDHAMLAAAMPVYDAFYAWCRDPGETHAWQQHVPAVAA